MKNTNDSKSKIKKQILSGAVYIALAVTVFAFTVNTITSSFANSVEKSLNEVKIDYPSQNGGSSTGAKQGGSSKTPSGFGIYDFDFDTPVSDTKSGVDATVVVPDNENDGASEVETVENVLITGEDEASENVGAPQSGGLANSVSITEFAPGEEPEDVFDEQYIGFDGFIRPCGGFISKEFSIELPVYSATMYDYRTHAGIDIACEVGSIVRASKNGEISEIYDDPLMGRTLVIEHKDGLTSVYSNLSPDMPSDIYVGKIVSTGDTIGGVGNSALCESAEASHLHFEIRKNGSPVNPEDYFEN